MAVENLESERYPYLPVEVRLGDQSIRFQALVDTGFDGDVAVPRGTGFEEEPVGYRNWGFADESLVRAPIYYGIVRLGAFDPVPARITALDGAAVVGRGVIDRYRTLFDRGERIVVEL